MSEIVRDGIRKEGGKERERCNVIQQEKVDLFDAVSDFFFGRKCPDLGFDSNQFRNNILDKGFEPLLLLVRYSSCGCCSEPRFRAPSPVCLLQYQGFGLNLLFVYAQTKVSDPFSPSVLL